MIQVREFQWAGSLCFGFCRASVVTKMVTACPAPTGSTVILAILRWQSKLFPSDQSGVVSVASVGRSVILWKVGRILMSFPAPSSPKKDLHLNQTKQGRRTPP